MSESIQELEMVPSGGARDNRRSGLRAVLTRLSMGNAISDAFNAAGLGPSPSRNTDQVTHDRLVRLHTAVIELADDDLMSAWETLLIGQLSSTGLGQAFDWFFDISDARGALAATGTFPRSVEA